MKKSYTKKEDIPEAFQDEYEEKEGVWLLKVDDATLVEPSWLAKHNEFRENNRKLTEAQLSKDKELAALRTKYEGIDPELWGKFKKQIEDSKQDAEKALLAEGKLDEVVTMRTKAAIGGIREEFQAKSEAYDVLQTKYEKLYKSDVARGVQDELLSLLDNKSMQPRNTVAAQDLKRILVEDWTRDEEGKMVPRQGLMGPNGDQITKQEYVDIELLKRRDYLFQSGKGGGAPGGGPAPTDGIMIIDKNDLEAKGKNLEALAKGKARVTP